MGDVRDLWDAGNPQAPAGFSSWGEEVSDAADQSARGLVARVTSSSDSATYTDRVDIAGMVLNFTAETGRKYRIDGYSHFAAASGTANGQLNILVDDTAVDFAARPGIVGTGAANTPRVHVLWVLDGAGASVEVKLQAAGSGDGVTIPASGQRQIVLEVYDIGPA